jgi:hypothetical protein
MMMNGLIGSVVAMLLFLAVPGLADLVVVFISPTVIDFENAPNAQIDDYYQNTFAVTFENFVGQDNIGEDSKVACNFPYTTAYPPVGEVLFDDPVLRAGFYILAAPQDSPATVTAYLAGVEVGFDYFVTDLDGSFAGIEFASGFDRIASTAAFCSRYFCH